MKILSASFRLRTYLATYILFNLYMLKFELEKLGVSTKYFKEDLIATNEQRKRWRSRKNEIDPIAYQKNEMIIKQLDIVIFALK